MILSITVLDTADEAAPTIDVGAGCEQAVDLEVGGVGRGVAGVTLFEDDVGAEHATGGVDVLDGHVGTGDLGRSEEGEVTRDRAGSCRR